jgi:hypothetical protein
LTKRTKQDNWKWEESRSTSKKIERSQSSWEEIHEGATAVEACNTRAPSEEPIQSGVQAARVEDSKSSEERKMAE